MGRPSFSCGCWRPKLRAKFTQKGSHLLTHPLAHSPARPSPPTCWKLTCPWRQEHIALLEPTSLERTLLDALLGNSHTNRLEAVSF